MEILQLIFFVNFVVSAIYEVLPFVKGSIV